MGLFSFVSQLSRERGEGLGSPGLGCSASLFDLYWRHPPAVRPHISSAPASFRDSGKQLIEVWNRANSQAVVWAASRWLDVGKAVIEVFDASQDPFWLVYPVDGQWQADEWDGTSHRVPTLKAALELIFPF